MNDSNVILEVENLTKRYGDFTALDRVSFRIMPGEFVGLIGPNGAGKTTLIHSIVSYVLSDEGQIKIRNYNIADHESYVKSRYGYSPDTSHFPESLTAWDILNFAASLKHIQDADDEIERLLDLTGLRPEARKPVYAYSTGMCQKLSVCIALMGSPEFIILDETLNGIDPVSSYGIKRYLKSLTSKGVSVLMSSHILETVEKYCDRIIIINHGRIQAEITHEQLISIRANENKDLEELFIELLGKPERSGAEK